MTKASQDAGEGEATGRRGWRGQVPRDVILIVLGAALAFAGEEWRDARHRQDRVEVAVSSIRNELAANRALVGAARQHHLHMADTLGALMKHHLQPDVSIYLNGMWNPAIVTSTAWQAARETGALGDISLTTVLGVAPAYEAQERYRSSTDAIGNAILADMRREGMDIILRDRFAQFVPLDVDFSNRERVLLAEYDKALEKLAQYR